MYLRKTILIFVVLIISKIGNAQNIYKELYQQDEELQKVHFGIHVGFVQSHYNVLHTSSFLIFDSINVVESFNASGFNIAGLLHIKLNKNFDLRTYPLNLVFTEKSLLFRLKYPDLAIGEDSTTIKKVSGVSLALPIEIKFNSDRINNFKVSLASNLY